MAEVAVTSAQNGATVTAGAGDTVVVRLPENPTTGYRWAVTAGGSPSADTFRPGGSAPGAAGERVLSFKAPASGTMRLELALRRAWETGGAAQSSFSVTIALR